MSISQLTLTSSDEEPVRRFEVFTGSSRRREWSDERKAEIVAESYEPSSGAIELEIGGAIVRIASGADAATIAAVIQAVKAQS